VDPPIGPGMTGSGKVLISAQETSWKHAYPITSKKKLPAGFPLLAVVLILVGLAFVSSRFIDVGPRQSLTRSSSVAGDELAKVFQAQ
jgi:hypothetical protein